MGTSAVDVAAVLEVRGELNSSMFGTPLRRRWFVGAGVSTFEFGA